MQNAECRMQNAEPTLRSESRGCLHTLPSREEEKQIIDLISPTPATLENKFYLFSFLFCRSAAMLLRLMHREMFQVNLTTSYASNNAMRYLQNKR